MKFFILIPIVLSSTEIQCHATNSALDCSMFKNGRFILVNEEPLMKGELIRNGNYTSHKKFSQKHRVC